MRIIPSLWLVARGASWVRKKHQAGKHQPINNLAQAVGESKFALYSAHKEDQRSLKCLASGLVLAPFHQSAKPFSWREVTILSGSILASIRLRCCWHQQREQSSMAQAHTKRQSYRIRQFCSVRARASFYRKRRFET